MVHREHKGVFDLHELNNGCSSMPALFPHWISCHAERMLTYRKPAHHAFHAATSPHCDFKPCYTGLYDIYESSKRNNVLFMVKSNKYMYMEIYS